MPPSILTRGQIITQGVEVGGRGEALKPKARIFLSLFEDSLYRGFEWPFLLREAAITFGQGATEVDISGVSGFNGRIQMARLQGQGDWILRENRYDDLWAKVKYESEQGSQGIPTDYATKYDLKKLVLWPIPQQSYTMDMLYYRVPPYYDPTEDSDGYDESIPELDYAKPLVDAVVHFTKFYDQEESTVMAERLASAEIQKAKSQTKYQGASSPLKLRLNPNIYRRLRIDDR